MMTSHLAGLLKSVSDNCSFWSFSNCVCWCTEKANSLLILKELTRQVGSLFLFAGKFQQVYIDASMTLARKRNKTAVFRIGRNEISANCRFNEICRPTKTLNLFNTLVSSKMTIYLPSRCHLSAISTDNCRTSKNHSFFILTLIGLLNWISSLQRGYYHYSTVGKDWQKEPNVPVTSRLSAIFCLVLDFKNCKLPVFQVIKLVPFHLMKTPYSIPG